VSAEKVRSMAQWVKESLHAPLQTAWKCSTGERTVRELLATGLDRPDALPSGETLSLKLCEHFVQWLETSLRLHRNVEQGKLKAVGVSKLSHHGAKGGAVVGEMRVFLEKSVGSPAHICTQKTAELREKYLGSGKLPTGKYQDPDAAKVCSELSPADIMADSKRVAREWESLYDRVSKLHLYKRHIDTVNTVSALVASSGAPLWANKLKTTPVGLSGLNHDEETLAARDPEGEIDPLTPVTWRRAWELKKCMAKLKQIDHSDELQLLSRERVTLQKRLRRLVGQLVVLNVEHHHMTNMTDVVKSSLVRFTAALERAGNGDGARATRYRRDAKAALAQCIHGFPCWIMPTWRVSQFLPAEIGQFDLVIVDEASQSDLTALPALFRGQKMLVVGDSKQVSPSEAFRSEDSIAQLRQVLQGRMPFPELMLPGRPLFDLTRAAAPSNCVTLLEHFRCVAPIVQYSNVQCYNGRLQPLRIPSSQERLDPPLIDVYVPGGRKSGKINPEEVNAIVNEIDNLVAEESARFAAHQGTGFASDRDRDADVNKEEGDDDVAEAEPEGNFKFRTIGVISLAGGLDNHQAKAIKKALKMRVSDALCNRHSIMIGDPATFQGSERDIIMLSMVAARGSVVAQTGLRYEQTYNVALSRARNRMYLFRSVQLEDVPKKDDMKAAVIRFFQDPMSGGSYNEKKKKGGARGGKKKGAAAGKGSSSRTRKEVAPEEDISMNENDLASPTSGAKMLQKLGKKGGIGSQLLHFDKVEEHIQQRLVALGFTVLMDTQVGKLKIDLVVESGAEDDISSGSSSVPTRLGIVLDGDVASAFDEDDIMLPAAAGRGSGSGGGGNAGVLDGNWKQREQRGEERVRKWTGIFEVQNSLERVGWSFWRCWTPGFIMDPEVKMQSLLQEMDRLGMRPNKQGSLHRSLAVVEQRDPRGMSSKSSSSSAATFARSMEDTNMGNSDDSSDSDDDDAPLDKGTSSKSATSPSKRRLSKHKEKATSAGGKKQKVSRSSSKVPAPSTNPKVRSRSKAAIAKKTKGKEVDSEDDSDEDGSLNDFIVADKGDSFVCVVLIIVIGMNGRGKNGVPGYNDMCQHTECTIVIWKRARGGRA
jgi:hypothetical protein